MMSEHNCQMSRRKLSICLPTMLDSISREYKRWHIGNYGCCIFNWSFIVGRIEEKHSRFHLFVWQVRTGSLEICYVEDPG